MCGWIFGHGVGSFSFEAAEAAVTDGLPIKQCVAGCLPNAT